MMDKILTVGKALVFSVAALRLVPVFADVVIENEAFRLVLDDAAYAKSLVCRQTGEECLMPGVRLPFCTITQYRPYDNENWLTHPAKPTVYPAKSVRRDGDGLVFEFADTADVAYVSVKTTPAYVEFKLSRLDFRIEDFGIKRKTETDEFALVRLPVASRRHFGEWLNVMWDDRTAVALFGDSPETRIDAFAREDGAREFYAGMENRVKLEGCGAILVASAKDRFLGTVERMEKDYGMPNGAEARRLVGTGATFYWTACITPGNVDRHIAVAKACGFKYLMIYYTAFARTCGHFEFSPKRYPRGLADLKEVASKIRAAGLVPGLHFHYNKASMDDAYVSGGVPDSRLHGLRELLLARPLSAEDTTIYLQGNPSGILVEPVAGSIYSKREGRRRLVQIGNELIHYGKAVCEPPYRLEGCVRGALGTKAAAHDASERFRHLDVDDVPTYVRIDQNTDLQDEIAARVASIIRTCGFRFYHYDGAEDVPEPYWYNVARAQTRVRRAIGDMQDWARSAALSQYSWHAITHGSGFDMFPHERLRESIRRYWSKKAFLNNESFTTTDFGSIDVRLPDEMRKYSDGTERLTTAMQPDHAELIYAKAIAWNGCCGLRIYREEELNHPLLPDICAALNRWGRIRAAGALTEKTKCDLRDNVREWFVWPFDFDPRKPELVEYRPITADDERPLRAFSYTRGGKGGIAYWAVGEKTPPEVPLEAPGLVVRHDMARCFVEADLPEAELVGRFKALGINGNKSKDK